MSILVMGVVIVYLAVCADQDDNGEVNPLDAVNYWRF